MIKIAAVLIQDLVPFLSRPAGRLFSFTKSSKYIGISKENPLTSSRQPPSHLQKHKLMGSDLYTISVHKIEKRKVTLHVDVIHPDVDMFYEDKNIALQHIVDSYWLLKMGYTWDMGISKEQAKEILAQSPYIKQLDEWLEIMHGQEISISKAEYDAIQKSGDYTFEGKKISSLSSSGDSYSINLETDYAAFMRLADLIILDIEVDDDLLIFEVLEEGVIAHFYEGMSFASRAYDFTYYANR